MRAALSLGTLLGIVLSFASAAHAQSGVTIEVDDVTDNRVSAGRFGASLELRVKAKGTGLDKVAASRLLVKEAHDDHGTSLVDPQRLVPEFMGASTTTGCCSSR